MSSHIIEDKEKVFLNVGGQKYVTSKQTLSSIPDTFFTALLEGPWTHNPGEEIFIDRDGESFRYILQYLRDGSLPFPLSPRDAHYLAIEARFYSLKSLEEAISCFRESKSSLAVSKFSRSDLPKKFTWKVVDMSDLRQSVFSQEFHTGRLRWRLQLVPRDPVRRSDTFGLFLVSRTLQDRGKMRFREHGVAGDDLHGDGRGDQVTQEDDTDDDDKSLDAMGDTQSYDSNEERSMSDRGGTIWDQSEADEREEEDLFLEGEGLMVHFQLRLLQQNQFVVHHCKRFAYGTMTTQNPLWGYNKFLSLSELRLEPQLFVNDTIFVEVEVINVNILDIC